MINLNQKLFILQQILEELPTNYADSFKEDIRLQLEGYRQEELNVFFLSKLNAEDDIRSWVDKLTSRIVMHEDDEQVNEIIQDYILLG